MIRENARMILEMVNEKVMFCHEKMAYDGLFEGLFCLEPLS